MVFAIGCLDDVFDFEGMKPTDRYSKLKWPRQLVTTTKQRNLWKAALEAAFAPSG
jgi:hypothetical protein